MDSKVIKTIKHGNKCNDDQLENNLSTVVDSDVGQQKSMQEEIQPEQFPDSENDNDDGLLGKLVNCTGGNGDRRDFKILGSRIGFNVTANVDFHEPLVMLCSMSALGEFNPSEVPLPARTRTCMDQSGSTTSDMVDGRTKQVAKKDWKNLTLGGFFKRHQKAPKNPLRKKPTDKNLLFPPCGMISKLQFWFWSQIFSKSQ